jgi:hypothetical protein
MAFAEYGPADCKCRFSCAAIITWNQFQLLHYFFSISMGGRKGEAAYEERLHQLLAHPARGGANGRYGWNQFQPTCLRRLHRIMAMR